MPPIAAVTDNAVVKDPKRAVAGSEHEEEIRIDLVTREGKRRRFGCRDGLDQARVQENGTYPPHTYLQAASGSCHFF